MKLNKIKAQLPDSIYNFFKKVNHLRFCIEIYKKSEKQRKSDKKRIFLIFTPEHNNLGDHAIAKAELEFLKDYDVFEITSYSVSLLLEFPKIFKKLLSDDLIIFNGGGYLGTLWFNIELNLRKILNLCKGNNNIIIFPQTVFYENDEFGKKEFEKSKQIYNKYDNLVITSREKVSYEVMKNAYKNVYLIPDMALSLNECKNNCTRSGVQLTLRDDHEKTMSKEYRDNLISYLTDKFGENIRFADMGADDDVPPENRNQELDKHFDKFRSSELVVTDRLHGMIFAAITGTPCIVLNSKSPKVKGVYDWLFKDCEYITFTDDFEEMSAFIENIKGKNFVYDNSVVIPYYDELKDIVKREISGE